VLVDDFRTILASDLAELDLPLCRVQLFSKINNWSHVEQDIGLCNLAVSVFL
jgi:hypothetical protein